MHILARITTILMSATKRVKHVAAAPIAETSMVAFELGAKGVADTVVSIGTLRRARARYSDQCWGCLYDFHGGPEGADAVRKIWKSHLPLYGQRHPDAIYEIVSQLHEDEIRGPLKAAGTDIPKWTPAQVRTHLKYHVVDPFICAMDDVETATSIIDEAKDALFRKTPEGNLEPIETNLAVLQCWMKQRATSLREAHMLRPR
jgi:hypothetical protein